MMKLWTILLAVLIAVTCAYAAAESAVDGVWEGAWYRGMTSGKLRLELRGTEGTVQFTGLDTFGTAARPLQTAELAGTKLSLRAVGQTGLPLSVDFSVKPAAAEMKGLGVYEGFAFRFELRRTVP